MPDIKNLSVDSLGIDHIPEIFGISLLYIVPAIFVLAIILIVIFRKFHEQYSNTKHAKECEPLFKSYFEIHEPIRISYFSDKGRAIKLFWTEVIFPRAISDLEVTMMEIKAKQLGILNKSEIVRGSRRHEVDAQGKSSFALDDHMVSFFISPKYLHHKLVKALRASPPTIQESTDHQF